MGFETLATEMASGVLTVTLNRPDKLNAFNTPMMHDLLAVLDEIDADDAVRAVIFTGAGRGFCAGADLSSGARTFDHAAEGADTASKGARRDGGGRVTLRIYNCTKPIIAAFNGPAVGIGVTMSLPMDIRLASEEAKFGFVFARRGIAPEAASSWFLPRVVGISKAMEWVATGRIFGAEEAREGGLVSEVLAPEALLPRAQELAAEIAANTSAVSVALSRQMMWKMLGAQHPMEAHRIDSAVVDFMGARADAREGVESFLQKRPAEFSMRVSSDLPNFYPWWEEPKYED
ncbi:MAG: crotonase/enoyl-CoA hydratase family protein [Myxococcota bacterium]|nr:crotonase/enoyl-CoA hydratase family protein [Myxococcota bacterium]